MWGHVSLDGVIQHENDENFAYGNWTMPFRSPAGLEAVEEAQGNRFDLLPGRHTYDLWSGYWPKAGTGPIANRLNAATKYVATHRPDSLEWGPAEDLGADSIAGIRSLKSTDGPDLIVWGSSTLTPVLLDQGLADEVAGLPGPTGSGQTLLFGQCRPVRTRFGQHEGYVHGCAHKHLPIRWIAANLISDSSVRLNLHLLLHLCPTSDTGRAGS